jgi:hypothetical protein
VRTFEDQLWRAREGYKQKAVRLAVNKKIKNKNKNKINKYIK